MRVTLVSQTGSVLSCITFLMYCIFRFVSFRNSFCKICTFVVLVFREETFSSKKDDAGWADCFAILLPVNLMSSPLWCTTVFLLYSLLAQLRPCPTVAQYSTNPVAASFNHLLDTQVENYKDKVITMSQTIQNECQLHIQYTKDHNMKLP